MSFERGSTVLTIGLVGLGEGGGVAVLAEVPEADGSAAAAEGDQVRLVRVAVHALDGQVLVRAGEKRRGELDQLCVVL